MKEKKEPKVRKAVDGDKYISTTKADYQKALRLIINYFEKLNYRTLSGYACYDKSNRAIAVANVFCIPESELEDKLALIITFPKKRQSSTGRLLKRLEKFSTCWKSQGVVLAYSRGTGSFPIITDRLWASKRLVRIFSLNLNTDTMRELTRQW